MLLLQNQSETNLKEWFHKLAMISPFLQTFSIPEKPQRIELGHFSAVFPSTRSCRHEALIKGSPLQTGSVSLLQVGFFFFFLQYLPAHRWERTTDSIRPLWFLANTSGTDWLTALMGAHNQAPWLNTWGSGHTHRKSFDDVLSLPAKYTHYLATAATWVLH